MTSSSWLLSLLISVILLKFQYTIASRFSPIVGILSEPFFNARNNVTEYMIAASYTKWLELGGMRAVAIPYDASSDQQIDALFGHLNGVLLPGGGGKELPYVAKRLWKLAHEANLNNDKFFPIWGTCLGFEYLVMLASENDGILQGGFDAENMSLPLHPRSGSSRLYQGFDTNLLQQNVSLNNHHFGISPISPVDDDDSSYEKLSTWFDFTTVSADRNGRLFVSTIESRYPDKYPYYGVQYHPEKNAFEYGTRSGEAWSYENINHSPAAIYLCLHLAQFFGNLTRINIMRSATAGSTVGDYYPWVYTYEHRFGFKFQEFYIIPSPVQKGDWTSVPI